MIQSPNTLNNTPETETPLTDIQEMQEFNRRIDEEAYVPTVHELGENWRRFDTLAPNDDRTALVDQQGTTITPVELADATKHLNPTKWMLGRKDYGSLLGAIQVAAADALDATHKAGFEAFGKKIESTGKQPTLEGYQQHLKDKMSLSEKLYEVAGEEQPKPITEEQSKQDKEKLLKEGIDEAILSGEGKTKSEREKQLKSACDKVYEAIGRDTILFMLWANRHKDKDAETGKKIDKPFPLTQYNLENLGFSNHKEFEIAMATRFQAEQITPRPKQALPDKPPIDTQKLITDLKELPSPEEAGKKTVGRRIRRIFKRESADESGNKRAKAARAGGALALAATLTLTAQQATAPSHEASSTVTATGSNEQVAHPSEYTDVQRVLDDLEADEQH